MVPGPRALTGPSKLYMKGLRRYRPCAADDRAAGGEEKRGSNGDRGGRGCGQTDDRAEPECGSPRQGGDYIQQSVVPEVVLFEAGLFLGKLH